MVDLPPALHTVYLQNDPVYNQLANQLRMRLRFAGTHLVDSPNEAPITLAILKAQTTTNQTSIGNSQQARNYEETYTITYTLINSKGQTVYGPKSVSSKRTINILATEVLGNSNKPAAAKKNMQQDAINKIMFQISSKNAFKALKHVKQ